MSCLFTIATSMISPQKNDLFYYFQNKQVTFLIYYSNITFKVFWSSAHYAHACKWLSRDIRPLSEHMQDSFIMYLTSLQIHSKSNDITSESFISLSLAVVQNISPKTDITFKEMVSNAVKY